jgi:hypothetical protein
MTVHPSPSEKDPSFLLVLIKPSHCDDAGYVIQWARSLIPSNTLAVMNSLPKDIVRPRTLSA